jgi:hypothetical protein
MSITDRQEPTAINLALMIPSLAAGFALIWFAFAGYLSGSALRPGDYWWFGCLGLAALTLGVFARSGWQKAGVLVALFIAGFSAQLALKDPLWFQHFELRPRTPLSVVLMIVPLGQAVLSAGFLYSQGAHRRLWPTIQGLGPFRFLILVAALTIFSTSVMEQIAVGNPGSIAAQFIATQVFVLANVANFLALLVALPGERLLRLTRGLPNSISCPGREASGGKRADRVLSLVLAALVFTLCALVAVFALEGVPHLDDISYRFQATYMAHGNITVPIPPSVEAFDKYLMDSHDGRWFTTMFPGWAAALAIAKLLGIEILLTPLLGAVGILLMHKFAAEMVDRGTANLVVLLLAISPWYLTLSSNPLIHTFSIVLFLGAWLLLLQSRKKTSAALSFLAGLLVGWVFLSRPLEGLYIGTMTGLWALTFLAKDRQQWKTVVSYGLGCLALAILIFPYNQQLTGSYLKTPLNTYYEKTWGPGSNSLGFGPEKGAVPDWGRSTHFRATAHWKPFSTRTRTFRRSIPR